MPGLEGPDIPDADKQAVKRHARRYDSKCKKPFPEDADMPEEIDALREMLQESADLEECEDAYARLAQLLDGKEDEALDEAREKIESLKQEDREPFEDSFEGDYEIVETFSDGRMRVRAIVAQVDTVNKNKRLYPKTEMVKALDRANKLAKRGSIVGLADHPGLFSGGGVRDIVVRWEKLMLKGKDVHAEGVTVLTDAGRDVTTAWQSGVALEWSTRGYGRSEEVTNKKGDWTHDNILDYIMDGIDVVLRGAASTRTLSLSVENQQRPDEAEDEITMDDKSKKPDEIADGADGAEATPPPAPVAETKTDPPAAPAINIDEIVEKVAAKVAEGQKGVADLVNEQVEAGFAVAALKAYKDQKIAELTVDDAMKVPVLRALEAATTIEAVDEAMTSFAPMLERVLKPAVEYRGYGIVTEQSRQQIKEDNWVLGKTVCERPNSPEDVRTALVEAFLATLDSEQQEMVPGTRGYTFARVVDALWGNEPKLFQAATKDGARLLEATTTTSTMGTIQPQILPMLYSLWPKLIPFEIASVQPLSGPSGVIHSLAIQDAATDNDLSDSGNFDSTFADHTEAATKAQVKPVITPMTVTATEKAIYYDVTSALRQDMRNVHGIDLDALMIGAATDEIAREINLTFLDLMLQGASAGTQTYGTQVPTSPTYNTQEWNNRLGAFITRAKTMVQEKVYETPDWVVCGPGAAGVLQAMNAGGIQIGDRIQYGSGLNFIGIMGNTIRVYEATWFSRNDMLFGFRPPMWSKTGAVYAPYVPLYVSPEDYTASTNTYARSVATRDAMKLTNGNCYSRITIANSAGTDITSW